MFDERFPGWLQKNGQIKPLASKTKFNNFRDELARIFEQHNYLHHKQTKNITVNEWFDYRPENEPFIEWLGCARTWRDSIDCGNLTRIDSIHSRRCTTILHRGAMTYDALRRPHLFNTTKDSNCSLNYFDAKEVIKMVLNFEPEDYGDLKRQIGARISFHDSNMVSSLNDLDYFVTRGYRYDFSINRRDIKFTNGPHDKCLKYDQIYLDKFKYHIEPRNPLGANTCFQNCVARNTIHHSSCWPPPIPYFRNDSLDPGLKLKQCDWYKMSQHSSLFYELMRIDEARARKQGLSLSGDANYSTIKANDYEEMPDGLLNKTGSAYEKLLARRRVRDAMRRYRKTLRFCWSKCPWPCKLTTYTVTMTKSAWPTDVKIIFDKTGKERRKRHCCALIAIRFTHFHYSIHEFKPKYDISNTVNDLGGLLAFWLGLSIVSIYHAINKLVTLTGRHIRLKMRT